MKFHAKIEFLVPRYHESEWAVLGDEHGVTISTHGTEIQYTAEQAREIVGMLSQAIAAAEGEG